MTDLIGSEHIRRPFCHDALFYESDDEFFLGAISFIRAGIRAGEPTFVVLSTQQNEALRNAIGRDQQGIFFADTAIVGHNPAQIIPAWRRFADANPKVRVRGLSEPIAVGGDDATVSECQRHEALLNVAFDGHPFSLLCLYDVSGLSDSVIKGAMRRHEYIVRNGSMSASLDFVASEHVSGLLDDPLGAAPEAASWQAFTVRELSSIRELVREAGNSRGMSNERMEEFAVAVNEIASNSIVHGGGRGTLAIWHESDRIVCEVRDDGNFAQPLADRTEPDLSNSGGRGLWLANVLCDLVQIRSGEFGTCVRVHLRLS